MGLNKHKPIMKFKPVYRFAKTGLSCFLFVGLPNLV